jgi:hypothetical protein
MAFRAVLPQNRSIKTSGSTITYDHRKRNQRGACYLDKWRDHYYSTQDIGFYFASSDRELIEKVSSIMKRNGHISFSDSMGREHYLLDGRSGVPVLTRNIDTVTKRIVSKNKDEYESMRPFFSQAIDQTLEASGLPNQLKGYRYIKFILYRLIEDDSLVSPISKTVYPGLCELYHCTSFQIERDIRYAIKKCAFADRNPSPKVFICLLLEMANRIAYERKSMAEAMQRQGRGRPEDGGEESCGLDTAKAV